MIFSVGSPKNIIEFPLSGLEILQGCKLDPEFLRNLLESPDTLADQLARPVILGVDVTFDEDLFSSSRRLGTSHNPSGKR